MALLQADLLFKHCVDGDVLFLCEWLKFDPSFN